MTANENFIEPKEKSAEKELVMKNEKHRKEIKLASVKNLRKAVEDSSHPALRDLVANHTFVGKLIYKAGGSRGAGGAVAPPIFLKIG